MEWTVLIVVSAPSHHRHVSRKSCWSWSWWWMGSVPKRKRRWLYAKDQPCMPWLWKTGSLERKSMLSDTTWQLASVEADDGFPSSRPHRRTSSVNECRTEAYPVLSSWCLSMPSRWDFVVDWLCNKEVIKYCPYTFDPHHSSFLVSTDRGIGVETHLVRAHRGERFRHHNFHTS